MTKRHDKPMNLEAIRSRLASARGEEYWRCLEELADAEELEEFVARRCLPGQPSLGRDPLSRRRFLALMAASLGLAGLTGCILQPPTETIVPYVRAPEEMILGKPLFFATTMTLGGDAVGLLVESHEGRPTKVEGNPLHPASSGATDALAQASVLCLYDPDRSQTVLFRGQIRAWDDALEAIATGVAAQREKQGAGLRLLTETVTSPTLGSQIQKLLELHPRAKWHQYEPAGRDMAYRGRHIAPDLLPGEDVDTHYRFDRAERILSLDADFLATGPGHLRYARDFTAGRRLSAGSSKAERKGLNRLYMVQSTPTITGAKADHLWPLPASRIEAFARAVAVRLDRQFRARAPSDFSEIPAVVLDEIAADLGAVGDSSLVIAGEEQPPAVHALAHAMNHLLDNVGQTVIYTDPIEARPEDQIASLGQLVEDMHRGLVDMLVILGGNPVFTAPADFRFGDRLLAKTSSGKSKVPLRIHLSQYVDETSARCDWHLPETHYLEMWSDARAYDGTASIVQPLVAPLYAGKCAHEVLAALAGEPQRPGYDLVRSHWRRVWEKERLAQPGAGAAERDFLSLRDFGSLTEAEREDAFARFWRTALHDGIVAGTALAPKTVSLRKDWAERLGVGEAPAQSVGITSSATSAARQEPRPPGAASDTLEIVFRPDPTLFDGRFANNGWLQELPKPLTRLTWGNAALMSPATAKRLGLASEPSGHGGEHGEAMVDVVELRYRGATLEAPILPIPGQPDDTVTLHLGHGRTMAGSVGNGVGASAYLLRTSTAPWFDAGVEIRKTGKQYPLACVQYHHSMAGREPVLTGTVHEDDEGRRSIAIHRKPSAPEVRMPSVSLYPEGEHPYNAGYKWGMAIDLTACTGCGACVAACQAENNSPVVGKEQVLRGREMHWIRVDRYYEGPSENPKTFFQPVPCMQCENAPCELVCPVAATAHSAEGLNDMVYNRCVGTRYCSNNCPYKVRRFNFLQFADCATPSLKLMRNPDVTVRSRGVMEKCTYCVQRITEARIRADKEADQQRRPTIRDGEIVTACQAACPAEAIVFGDLNDPESRVSKWKALEAGGAALNYALLAELNTRPRTTYLAALRNPNLKIT